MCADNSLLEQWSRTPCYIMKKTQAWRPQCTTPPTGSGRLGTPRKGKHAPAAAASTKRGRLAGEPALFDSTTKLPHDMKVRPLEAISAAGDARIRTRAVISTAVNGVTSVRVALRL